MHDELMDGQMTGYRWMDGRLDGWVDDWMDGWIDGWMDEQMVDGWMFRCVDVRLDFFSITTYGMGIAL